MEEFKTFGEIIGEIQDQIAAIEDQVKVVEDWFKKIDDVCKLMINVDVGLFNNKLKDKLNDITSFKDKINYKDKWFGKIKSLLTSSVTIEISEKITLIEQNNKPVETVRWLYWLYYYVKYNVIGDGTDLDEERISSIRNDLYDMLHNSSDVNVVDNNTFNIFVSFTRLFYKLYHLLTLEKNEKCMVDDIVIKDALKKLMLIEKLGKNKVNLTSWDAEFKFITLSRFLMDMERKYFR